MSRNWPAVAASNGAARKLWEKISKVMTTGRSLGGAMCVVVHPLAIAAPAVRVLLLGALVVGGCAGPAAYYYDAEIAASRERGPVPAKRAAHYRMFLQQWPDSPPYSDRARKWLELLASDALHDAESPPKTIRRYQKFLADFPDIPSCSEYARKRLAEMLAVRDQLASTRLVRIQGDRDSRLDVEAAVTAIGWIVSEKAADLIIEARRREPYVLKTRTVPQPGTYVSPSPWGRGPQSYPESDTIVQPVDLKITVVKSGAVLLDMRIDTSPKEALLGFLRAYDLPQPVSVP